MPTFALTGSAAGHRRGMRADSPPDRYGRGDIYLVVPPDEWSRTTELLESLDDQAVPAAAAHLWNVT
jgi:hypothetical protein